MPQGRRKTPFSGKAKKEQLKAKKQNKSGTAFTQGKPKKPLLVQHSDDEEREEEIHKVNYQPGKSGRDNRNRYALMFHRENDEEIRQRKELARKSIEPVAEEELEINGDDYFPKGLDFPKRPPWSFDMDRASLEAREQKYFTEYVKNLKEQFDWKELSYFEMNLETWRQLWRVVEMSDIILVIIDIRYPALMFPPSLYDHVVNTLKKDMIVVLNKIDLAPAALVVAWKNYFTKKYPNLHIVMFTTVPGYNLMGKQSDKAGLQVRRRRGRQKMAAEGTQVLFDACKKIVGDHLDLASWQQKIQEELEQEFEDGDKVEIGERIELKETDTAYYEHEKYKNGVLTIGCVGQPNVGKSSLLNAIMGRKVVSVSKTPGHTKHFQTIFLTNNVKLCDCPGLVFPSKVPKTLQILMGSFPIAQLREPFTTVKYLSERLDLPKLLRIDHPDGDDTWSAMDVCDGWAKKRGFVTARAARLDSYRAANNILRMALDGKICLCLRPPGFSVQKSFWQNHQEIETVKWIQAKSVDDDAAACEKEKDIYESSEEETEEVAAESEKEGESEEETEEESDSDDVVAVQSNKFSALNDE